MKQELIDRFELEHPNEPAYLPIVGGKEHLGIETSRIYSDAFQNWLMDTVIADLQSDNERLNEEYIKAHRLLIVRLGKIYELQEKYDKLNERVFEKSMKVWSNTYGTHEFFFQPGSGRKRYALVALTPEEMEMKDEN